MSQSQGARAQSECAGELREIAEADAAHRDRELGVQFVHIVRSAMVCGDGGQGLAAKKVTRLSPGHCD